jgi:hypothetical protein
MSSAPIGRRIVVPRPDRTTVVIVCGDVEVASWRLLPTGPPDLATVDELARLAVAVRRLGWSVRLERASAQLCDLLELTGLTRIVAGPGAGEPIDLVVQVGRETEEAEEVGIEEGMEPGDPIS